MLDRHRPKLLRNAMGRKVRTLRELTNANITLPAGMVLTITSGTGWNKLGLKGEPCSCCGVRPHITRVDVGSVEFLSVMKGDEDAV